MAGELKSLALTKTERKDESAPYSVKPGADTGPKYPYGTCLHLDDVTIKKLGLHESGAAGGEVNVIAKGKITSYSKNERVENGASVTHYSVTLQLTEMAVEPTASIPGVSKVLYGGES
jgi:hypothetical protein